MKYIILANSRKKSGEKVALVEINNVKPVLHKTLCYGQYINSKF